MRAKRGLLAGERRWRNGKRTHRDSTALRVAGFGAIIRPASEHSAMSVTPLFATSAERRRAAPWFMVEGGLLIVLGVVAAVLPRLAGVAGAAVFGWVLILAGVFGLSSVIGARRHAHMAWSIVSGLVALVVGALIVWAPLAGAIALAFLLALYLLVDGVALIALAWDQRKRAAKRWAWLMVSGVVDVVLAAQRQHAAGLHHRARPDRGRDRAADDRAGGATRRVTAH